MATISQRLRDLDRKVGREDYRRTPEEWRKAMSRWWLLIALAVSQGIVGLVGATLLGAPAAVAFSGLPVVAVYMSFQAGRMKAEHDRATGRDAWARIRPDSSHL